MEFLDVYTKDGQKTGQIFLRSEVHKKGLWHKAVDVWIINDNKEILIQLRSKNKENSPNMWDISAAGHASSGDSDIVAAMRETKEELGLVLKEVDIEEIGTIHFSQKRENYINNEINKIYIVKTDKKISDMEIQEEEVSDIKFIPFFELRKKIDKKDKSFVRHDEEYQILFKYLGI